jgi:uncharacterized protein (TIGR00369 family)
MPPTHCASCHQLASRFRDREVDSLRRVTDFAALDPNFEARVRASFGKQRVMETLGASLDAVAPGDVRISLPFRDDLTQQHGFLHAGVVAAILDSACGYAAFSLMASDAGVLTIEYKVNLLAPGKGDRVEAHAWVVRPGRTITVTRGDAYAFDGEERTRVATMQATVMTVTGRDDVRG